MSTLSQFMSGGGGGGEGPRNSMKMWTSACGGNHSQVSGYSRTTNAYSWVVPANFDPSVPLRVYVWGAGGCGGMYSSSGSSYGGGAGGLGISEITSLSAGDTVNVTVGAGCRAYNGQGGTSSFGSFVSATGGNAGACTTSNQGVTTQGCGGMGVSGNISNWRGGYGGYGANSSGSGHGGGGGSAPSPDGDKNGFMGGHATSYQGGGGASINFNGTYPYSSYASVGGSGTAGHGSSSVQAGTYYGYGGSGGAGILGAGGRGASTNSYSNTTISNDGAGDGQGSAIWTPNFILLGGGGGGGGAATTQSSENCGAQAGCGGPGAGGGSAAVYSSSATNSYMVAGNGGILGGGGGAPQYSVGGAGGNAGGGGGSGYGAYPTDHCNHSWGGDGLIFIQYKITF